MVWHVCVGEQTLCVCVYSFSFCVYYSGVETLRQGQCVTWDRMCAVVTASVLLLQMHMMCSWTGPVSLDKTAAHEQWTFDMVLIQHCMYDGDIMCGHENETRQQNERRRTDRQDILEQTDRQTDSFGQV